MSFREDESMALTLGLTHKGKIRAQSMRKDTRMQRLKGLRNAKNLCTMPFYPVEHAILEVNSDNSTKYKKQQIF